MHNSQIVSALKAFIGSDFIYKDYEQYDTFFGDVVLCRVFRYEPPDIASTGLVDTNGNPLINEAKRKIFTIGKVIGVGDKCTLDVKKGDMVALSDNLISIRDNPEFLQYLIETNGEASRGIEAARPSATVNSFIAYRQQYGFLGDKIKEDGVDPDDFFTFLFPSNFIKAKINPKTMLKCLS